MVLKAIVTGRVQGVGYRYFVRNAADGLGLRGWVRNLPDGSVEVEAEGNAASLENLVARLRQGPRFSAVADVEVTMQDMLAGHSSFEILD